jgi:hypothetical protein
MTRAEIAAMKRLVRARRVGVPARRSPPAGSRARCNFTGSSASLCGNPVLERYLVELVLQSSLAVALYEGHGRRARPRRSRGRWSNAIARKDGKRAARLMHEHLTELEHSLHLEAGGGPIARRRLPRGMTMAAMESTALHDVSRHEPIAGPAWEASRAHDAIEAIVRDIEDHLDPARGWPAHPQDEITAPATGLKSLYLGASGLLWSLWYLARCGAVTLKVQPADLVQRLHADYVAEPDTESVVPSYFLGEAGVLPRRLAPHRIASGGRAPARRHPRQRHESHQRGAMGGAGHDGRRMAHVEVDRCVPLA